MDAFLQFVGWLVGNILSQPSILLGVVALFGLLLQRRPFPQVLMGTIKTIVGVLIIGAGAGVLVSGISPLTDMMNHTLGVKGVMPTNEAVLPFALQNFGTMGALVMVGGFALNIILARFTNFKFIYLTGHIMFYVSLFVTAIFASVTKLDGWLLWIAGTITMGLYFTLMPALLYPYTQKITDGEKFTVGHTGDVGYWFSAWLGKFVGKPEDNAEKLNLPKNLGFFRDTTVSMAVTMVPIYIIVVLISGYGYVNANISKTTEPIVFAIMSGLTFAAGMTVVLAGVRMMLSEIVPAFAGISEKVVPGAVPALDCPVVFPYAPTALLLGFISMFIGMILGMFLQLGLAGTALGLYIILPGVVPAFFAGGTAGIFGNSTGGWRGAIVGPFIMGIALAIGTALLIPSTGALATTGNTFGDPFYATAGLAFAYWVGVLASQPIIGAVLLLVFLALAAWWGTRYSVFKGAKA